VKNMLFRNTPFT